MTQHTRPLWQDKMRPLWSPFPPHGVNTGRPHRGGHTHERVTGQAWRTPGPCKSHFIYIVLFKHPSPFSSFWLSTYLSLKIKHPLDGHIHSHSPNRIRCILTLPGINWGSRQRHVVTHVVRVVHVSAAVHSVLLLGPEHDVLIQIYKFDINWFPPHTWSSSSPGCLRRMHSRLRLDSWCCSSSLWWGPCRGCRPAAWSPRRWWDIGRTVHLSAPRLQITRWE